MSFSVGDLYCGAGGFAEGIQQAGFQVKWGVDNSPEAALTFKMNHPGAEVLRDDILSLNPRRLSRVDVIIGSPPCTDFSLANKGGNGDKTAGMKLVVRFLEIVRALKPKYWIMENVPNLLPHLNEVLDGDDFPLADKSIAIPNREILTSSDYGTPQTRKRLFCGDYPRPLRRTVAPSGRLTLGDVVESYPDPRAKPDGRRRVRDPVYPGIAVSEVDLRGHFEDHRWRLTPDEVEMCRRQKTAHRVYGKMAFPDSLDVPARTITSTRTHMSRATIVVDFRATGNGSPPYRTLTARECASVQGFPVTYQFWGSTLGDMDRMVGNAVPAPMAYALAVAILRAEGLREPSAPVVSRLSSLAPVLVRKQGVKSRRYPASRRFRGVCEAEWFHDCRVELDNDGAAPGKDPASGRPFGTEWVVKLYLGYAKKYKWYALPLKETERIVAKVVSDWTPSLAMDKAFADLSAKATRKFGRWVPDADTLQSSWIGNPGDGVSPYEVVKTVDCLVEECLPRSSWESVPVPRAIYSENLAEFEAGSGSEADPGCPKDITVRILGSLICLAIAADSINRRSEATQAGIPVPHATSASVVEKGEMAE